VAAARAGKPVSGTISNPARLDTAARVQLCAQCHRSPNEEFASSMPEVEQPASIRFAPVGLKASQCYQKSQRLSCTTCHDPHADPRPASDPFYTSVCLSCHKTAARHAAGRSCVACHMKKASPLPHLTFTDHRIRTYPE
jgi:hypothetical protein